jgi:hypothetical protein
LSRRSLSKKRSTIWRFARYYMGAPDYWQKGPPLPVLRLLRLLGPILAVLVAPLVSPWLSTDPDRAARASPAIPGEARWSRAGRLVGGARLPCTRRPCGPTPSTRASGGDTKLPKATLYSGSQIPGGGPYAHTAPIPPSVAASRVAVFNAGFLMSNATGGYFTDGETSPSLRQGRAPSSSTTTAPQQTGSGASTAPRRPPSCP